MRLVKLINWDNVKSVIKKATVEYKATMEAPSALSPKGQKIKEFIKCDCRRYDSQELLGLCSLLLDENLNDVPTKVPALAMVVPIKNTYPESKKKHGYAINKPILSDGYCGIRTTGSRGNNNLTTDFNTMRPATEAEIDEWFKEYDFEANFEQVYNLLNKTGCPY